MRNLVNVLLQNMQIVQLILYFTLKKKSWEKRSVEAGGGRGQLK